MTIKTAFRVAAATAFGLMATSATARTVTETFDFTAPGYETGPVLSSTSGALSLEASATVEGVGTDLSRRASGLYITYAGDTANRIDGLLDEAVNFVFSRAVNLEGLTFASIRPGSMFDLAIDGASAGSYAVEPLVALVGFGSSFGVTASDDGTAFKLTSITVSYDNLAPVPVPAGGLLLVGGLGALAAARRRKASK